MSIPGAFFLFLLAIARVAWIIHYGPTPLTLLLFAQAGLAGMLMIYRRKAAATAPVWVQAVAWISALLPLLFYTPASQPIWTGLLPIPGLALNLWALVSLGSAFGVSPARRGLVTTGPYRWLRHPMYTGELLSLLGGLCASPIWWNLGILLIFVASLVWRIRREENFLNYSGYFVYARYVRWRLIPGVW